MYKKKSFYTNYNEHFVFLTTIHCIIIHYNIIGAFGRNVLHFIWG